jgi:adenosyl cobinamide kinase/adenosyl cobinamide phosphate guanylyltransferase
VLTLLLGGARSGKSALALNLAASQGAPVVFVATAEPRDLEFAERIARHRAERPAAWETVEEPIDLERRLSELPNEAVVIIDCLTLWVSNLFERGRDDAAIYASATTLSRFAHDRAGSVVVVSNEVGSGIVPGDALSRRYRDALGRVNAIVAAAADEAFLVIAGRVVALQVPGPQSIARPSGPAR